MNRKRWLKKRRRKGLKKPLPINRVQCNAMGVTARPSKSANIVKKASRYGDILTLCEVANIDVQKVLGNDWDVAQDTSSWAKAGCAVALRKHRGKMKKWTIRLGVTARLQGKQANRMQNRYVVRSVLRIDPGTKCRWTFKPASGHGPPKRNWNPWWSVWIASVRSLVVHDIGADWNRDQKTVQRWMVGYNVNILGIDGFATKKWIPVSDVRKVDVGGDHPAIIQTLWPN